MGALDWLDHKLARPLRRHFETRADVRRLRALRERPLRIMVGASGTSIPGWHQTDQRYLDLLEPEQWGRIFEPGAVDHIFAEHVWEHLTPEQAVVAARTCHTFLAVGGSLRVAVPDGLHPNPDYVAGVRPGGHGAGADDHKVLYDYRSFPRVFESVGFQVELLEYFDESGRFHAVPWTDDRGHVRRSARYDVRNVDGELVYTSVILDAVKTAA
jgi:predicted SAM-dependent methyltransferase